jgi:hypothetical protein
MPQECIEQLLEYYSMPQECNGHYGGGDGLPGGVGIYSGGSNHIPQCCLKQ